MSQIRLERSEDADSIWQVNEAAFGRSAEANLVNALRERGKITLSLVAEQEGKIVGHILFSPVTITTDERVVTAVALGPMAVLPTCQREGIGSLLVRAGLHLLYEAGHHLIIVLGRPNFYPRFGFVRASLHGIQWEKKVPDEVFMVLALQPGVLEGVAGIVRYQPEFTAV